ncbi:tetratricopeptide repeat protein [Spongisporangium articulatum]|uniref:Tetratricopeptide repeat protein n=1 Tax=Spongisporangium articulatum TaxID=3362603 RepID=A0ABW8AQK4_9ACTN
MSERDYDGYEVFDLYRLGSLFLDIDDPRSAVGHLEAALEREPGDPAIERLLARALYRFAALGRAEELLRRIVERDPADVESTFLLGRTLQRRGRPVEARTYLRLAAAMDPSYL